MKRITAIAAGIAMAMAGASGAIAQSGTPSHRALVSKGCYTHSCAKRVWVKSHPHHASFRTASGGAGGILLAIRLCESGNNYGAATGNGFYGAYQFTPSTWAAYGGTGLPNASNAAEQDQVAARLLAAHGIHSTASWPNCP